MEHETAARRNRAPTHPGELLKADVLPDSGLSVAQAAALLGVSKQTLHAICREAGPVTPEMAVRLGALFGNGPDLWLNMQANHDLWHARKAMRSVVKKIEKAKAERERQLTEAA